MCNMQLFLGQLNLLQCSSVASERKENLKLSNKKYDIDNMNTIVNFNNCC